jgi:hypothetical protein
VTLTLYPPNSSAVHVTVTWTWRGKIGLGTGNITHRHDAISVTAEGGKNSEADHISLERCNHGFDLLRFRASMAYRESRNSRAG